MRSAYKATPIVAFALAGVGAVIVGGALMSVGQTEIVDTDGDGLISFAELLTFMPALTEQEFQALDANADGVLSTEELGAAEAAGLIPAG